MKALELEQGGRLAYDDTGSGRPILLLHGWSLCRRVFEPQVAGLAGNYRLLVPDLRGHGASRPAANGDGMQTLARDVAELVEALDLEDLLVVGWSMGAMVAWELALGSARKRMAGIATIDMVPRLINGAGWKHGLHSGEHAYDLDTDLLRMREDWNAFARAYVPKIFAAGRDAERQPLVESLLGMVEHNDVGSMTVLWTAMTREDYRDDIAKLGLPVLITHGRLSQVYGEAASAWMERRIPNSRRVAFEESGHAPHLEEPALFNEVLAEYAGSL